MCLHLHSLLTQSFGYICRSGIPGPCSSSVFSFLMTHYDFKNGYTSLQSQNNTQALIFLASPSAFICFVFPIFLKIPYSWEFHTCIQWNIHAPFLYVVGIEFPQSVLPPSPLLLFLLFSLLPPLLDKQLSLVSTAHRFMGMGPSVGGWKT